MKRYTLLWATTAIAASMSVIATILGMPALTWAQDDACYMITPAGKRVGLGKLCRGSGTTQPAARRFYQARIKRRQGGTPVIDVTLNGRGTFEMLVDTGASGTLVTRAMAQSLNIPIVGAGRFTLADGRTIVMPVGRLNSLTVSGATIRNVDVAIAGNLAEGLLGSDFLGNYDIKIKRDVIEFHPR